MAQTPPDLTSRVRGLKRQLAVHKLLKRGQATITDNETTLLDQDPHLYTAHMFWHRG